MVQSLPHGDKCFLTVVPFSIKKNNTLPISLQDNFVGIVGFLNLSVIDGRNLFLAASLSLEREMV